MSLSHICVSVIYGVINMLLYAWPNTLVYINIPGTIMYSTMSKDTMRYVLGIITGINIGLVLGVLLRSYYP